MPAAATGVSPARREELHRRGVRLEWFTVAWNVVEGVVAIGAGVVTGSVSLIGFGANSFIEVISAAALLWRLRKAGPNASHYASRVGSLVPGVGCLSVGRVR